MVAARSQSTAVTFSQCSLAVSALLPSYAQTALRLNPASSSLICRVPRGFPCNKNEFVAYPVSSLTSAECDLGLSWKTPSPSAVANRYSAVRLVSRIVLVLLFVTQQRRTQ
jgi:hypothetical protein